VANARGEGVGLGLGVGEAMELALVLVSGGANRWYSGQAWWLDDIESTGYGERLRGWQESTQ